MLLGAASDALLGDHFGDTPLHFASVHGHPMCAYTLAKACPQSCLSKNARGQTPVEAAVACQRGEVLNAMLLACAGDTSEVAITAMKKLLAQGTSAARCACCRPYCRQPWGLPLTFDCFQQLRW